MKHMKKLLAVLMAALMLAASMPFTAFAANDSMTIYGFRLVKSKNDEMDETEYGDAVVLESGGKYLLMDTGDATADASVVSYLNKIGVPKSGKKLDIYISHLHSDHIGGLDAVLDAFQVGTVYLPDQSIGKDYKSNSGVPLSEIYNGSVHGLVTRITNAGAKVEYLKKGSKFTVGGASAEVIGPVGSYTLTQTYNKMTGATQKSHYLNNYSLTTMFTCGGVKYLTGGDVEMEEEANLVKAYGTKLNADIYKANHHGLSTSNSESFLAKVTPTYTFMCDDGYEGTMESGGNTVTRHHTVLERLQEYGIPYMIANEAKPVIYKAEGGKVAMYRDADNDGIADAGEQINKAGWNKVKGLSMTDKGAWNGDDYYYFDANGKPLGGIRKIDGKWYNLAKGGARQQGLYKKDGSKWVFSGYRNYENDTKLRYYNPDGSMTVGFANITNKGKTYLFYFDEQGYQVHGDKDWTPIKLGGKKYALNESGVVFNNNGKGGLKTYGKKLRYFNKDGSMVTGWKKISGVKYYFDPDTGYRCSGLTEIDGVTYYFNDSGKLKTNVTLTISGVKCKIDKKGRIVSPKPAAPKSFKVKAKSKKKNVVTWKKVKKANGYIVYRATKKKGTYKAVKTIKKNSTVKFTDKKVKSKKKYYYKVCAYKKVGKKKINGKFTKVKYVKTK